MYFRQIVDFLPHGSDHTVCHGIRYDTNGETPLERNITKIDKITVPLISNTMSSHDQFSLHHQMAHRNVRNDVKSSFSFLSTVELSLLQFYLKGNLIYRFIKMNHIK